MDAPRGASSGCCSVLLKYMVTRLALLELATIPVLLWPEKVRESCSVCVEAAVLVCMWCLGHFVASYHQIRVQWMSVHVAGTQQ